MLGGKSNSEHLIAVQSEPEQASQGSAASTVCIESILTDSNINTVKRVLFRICIIIVYNTV